MMSFCIFSLNCFMALLDFIKFGQDNMLLGRFGFIDSECMEGEHWVSLIASLHNLHAE